ncbi:MAG TPA: hypothetical protein VE685_11695 [Thermoanaerobaculia bacterium]|nr:hypothetical protein [Thermoanaerobaculia bacterium]
MLRPPDADHTRETVVILLKLGVLGLIVYLLFFPDGVRSSRQVDFPPGGSESRTAIFAPVLVMDDGTRAEWGSCVVTAEDKNNKKIEVALGFLRGVRAGMPWTPLEWALGSTTHVGIDGSASLRIEDVIASSPEAETRPIIVVGTASHENSASNPGREEARAGSRADHLANLCTQRHSGADLYRLNLGFFQETRNDVCLPTMSSGSSGSERRIVMMVVTQQETGVDLTSGVRNALLEAAEVQACNFDARSYSNFDESRFRLGQSCPS